MRMAMSGIPYKLRNHGSGLLRIDMRVINLFSSAFASFQDSETYLSSGVLWILWMVIEPYAMWTLQMASMRVTMKTNSCSSWRVEWARPSSCPVERRTEYVERGRNKAGVYESFEAMRIHVDRKSDILVSTYCGWVCKMQDWQWLYSNGDWYTHLVFIAQFFFPLRR